MTCYARELAKYQKFCTLGYENSIPDLCKTAILHRVPNQGHFVCEPIMRLQYLVLKLSQVVQQNPAGVATCIQSIPSFFAYVRNSTTHLITY